MSTKSQGTDQFTEADKVKIIKKAQEEIGKHKKGVKKGDNFTSLTEEELREKLQRVNSPMIISQQWNNNALPKGIIKFSVTIFNPDPFQQENMYVHVFVGSGNIVADTGLFLLNVDTRFPRLTEPNHPGLLLSPMKSATLTFNIKMPAAIDISNFLGNAVLFRLRWSDVGTYYDRAAFSFLVG